MEPIRSVKDDLEKLRQDGQANMDALIQQLKEEKIINDGKSPSSDSSSPSDNPAGVIEPLSIFDVMQALVGKDTDPTAVEVSNKKDSSSLNPEGILQSLGVQDMLKSAAQKVDDLEETFMKLKDEGKNNVDSIVNILKDCTPKLIDDIKMTEEKARQLFEDPKQREVEIAKFKEGIMKVASEHRKTVDEVVKSLNDTKVVKAVKAGYSAFKDTLNK